MWKRFHITLGMDLQNLENLTLNNLDNNLKKLSLYAFDIDKESRVILGIIAKNGPLTETKIASLGKEGPY